VNIYESKDSVRDENIYREVYNKHNIVCQSFL